MILVVPPYLFLCIYHLPKRHMMRDLLYSFINFRTHYSFSVTLLYPFGFRLFLLQINNKLHWWVSSLEFYRLLSSS
jgi:hypothetical protein